MRGVEYKISFGAYARISFWFLFVLAVHGVAVALAF